MRNAFFSPAAIALLLGGCVGASAPAPAPPPEPAPSPGFFSAAQASRGEASYAESCRECHPQSQFRGADFEWRWRRQTAWQLYDEISKTMPEDQPGKLSSESYADIVAFLLSLNGYQLGSSDLPPDREELAAIPLGAGAEKTKPME